MSTTETVTTTVTAFTRILHDYPTITQISQQTVTQNVTATAIQEIGPGVSPISALMLVIVGVAIGAVLIWFFIGEDRTWSRG